MERIGRFKILKRLGSGGFGEVWLGHDEVIKREVAIKIFKPKDENLIAFATSTNTEGLDVLRARFLSEAQVLGSLEHNPYVINVLDFGELDDGSPYYVMPFLPNSLTDRLGKDIYDAAAIEELPEAERPRALSQEAALKWLDQLLQGLAAAHDKHLVHRDIKPSNIMLTDSGEARLVDFGIAKAPDGPHSTVSQLGMGSRNYMAPEQRESAKHVDARADIYAVGVVAYRMLTGRLPAGRFSDPNVHVPSLTQPISDLIVACLAEDKLERPENAAVLLKQLRAAAEGQATGEETGTWVASSNSSLRDELRPLKNEITQLLENDAEIDQSDRVRLEAMAAVAGLDPDGLQALIEQVEQEQGPVLQARQNFLRVIRDNSDSGDGIDRDMLHKVSAATGWSADKVDRVIDRQTKTDSVTAAVKPRSALRKVGRTLVVGIAVGIVVGIVALAGFWVWDTGQQRAQEEYRTAEKAKAEAQAKAEAKAEAEAKANRIGKLQSLLSQLEYRVTTNGKLDVLTQTAIENFERRQGLLVTGKVTDQLVDAAQAEVDRRGEAAGQLQQCAAHFKADRLLDGQAGNALECYGAVLQTDPGNPEAMAGITAIEDKYIAWTRRELERHNTARAATYLERLKKLNKERAEVAELERQGGVPSAAGRSGR